MLYNFLGNKASVNIDRDWMYPQMGADLQFHMTADLQVDPSASGALSHVSILTSSY